jgi:opacity protein-like surface antigen
LTEELIKLVMLALVAVTVALTASPAAAADAAQQEQNKRTVVEFYEKGLNQKYFGPRYTQHNPRAADGPEGFRVFLQFLRVSLPMATT